MKKNLLTERQAFIHANRSKVRLVVILLDSGSVLIEVLTGKPEIGKLPSTAVPMYGFPTIDEQIRSQAHARQAMSLSLRFYDGAELTSSDYAVP